MIFIAILNIVLWTYIVMLLTRGRKVEFECILRYRIVLSVIFFIYGLLQYMFNLNVYTLITLISFTIAAIVYYIAPCGLGKEEIVITGKLYPYSKMKNVSVYEENKLLTIEFEFNRRTYFLYAKAEDEDAVRKYLKKHCKRF